MGFLSKRKAKKEAKKAEANAAQAAADGAAAAQAVAKKEATKVPGEIKIQHQHRGEQSGNKKQLQHPSSGGKAMTFRRRVLGQSGGVKRAPIRTRPPRSPGGQSHVSAITRDTAFPETPKRRRFSPTASNLLPENDYDDYSDGEDDVGGGVVVTGRWSGGA